MSENMNQTEGTAAMAGVIPVPAAETDKAEKKPASKTKTVKKNVWQKLMSIQTVLKAPKNLYNSFGKYNYRNAEGILEAVKPYLAEQECVLIMEDKIEVIGEKSVSKTDKDTGEVITKTAPERYIKAVAHFIDCESGQEITTSAYANECEHTGMSGDQCTGTASSYARKYCLNALFLLDDTKDSDTDEMKNIENAANAKKQSAKQSSPKPAGNANKGWGNAPANQNAPASNGGSWGGSPNNGNVNKGWGQQGK